jgi:hypothetical protein
LHPWTAAPHLPAITAMSLRSSSSPHSTLRSRACGEHITTDEVARSFVVIYAPHTAKVPNYSTTSERSSCKDSPTVTMA